MTEMQQILDQVAALPGPPEPFVNPYLGHRALTEQEQELLGEYARLAGTINRVAALSSLLSSSSAHASLLTQLRVLERKMGLVLTLFKASVWAIVQEQQDAAEAEAMAAEAEARASMNGMGMDVGLEMGMGLHDGAYGAGDSMYMDGGDHEDDTITMQRGYY